MSINESTITTIILDIEGTTCPVDYVTGVLFPYASKAAGAYLENMRGNHEIHELVAEILKAWENDPAREAKELRANRAEDPIEAAEPYLQWLIKNDRKLTPLKTLQGKIWDEGYKRGDLVAPIFDDVAPTLRAWNKQSITISSYSSGSIQAQKLLYQYSTDGDLRPLFSHWFDTTTGNKKEATSYANICAAMDREPCEVLFVSDVTEELVAAQKIGMKTRFSKRKGNPEQSSGPFQSIEALSEISLNR